MRIDISSFCYSVATAELSHHSHARKKVLATLGCCLHTVVARTGKAAGQLLQQVHCGLNVEQIQESRDKEVRVNRLREEAPRVRTRYDLGKRRIDRARQADDGCVRPAPAEPLQYVETLQLRKLHIQNDTVRDERRHRLDRADEVASRRESVGM